MNKAKKTLSLVCVLAMLFTLLSAFTIVKADSNIKVTNTVSEGRTKDSEIEVVIKVEGIDIAQSVQFAMPIDTTKFEFVSAEKVVTSGTVMANYSTKTNQVKYALTNTEGSDLGDGTILKVKLKLLADLTSKETIKLTGVAITDNSQQVFKADNDEIDVSDIEIGKVTLTQGISNTVSGTFAKDDEIEITFKVVGFDIAQSIQFAMPIDTTKFEFVSVEKVVTSGTVMANYSTKTNQVKYALTNTEGSDLGDGTILKVKLKLLADLTSEETIKLTGVAITDNNQQVFKADSEQIFVDDVVIDPSSTPAATYTVTVADAENGTVAVDKTTAAEGDKVTITATAAEGYEVDTIKVTDADNKEVTVADDNTFAMPASNVTVTVTFKTSGGSTEDAYKLTVSASNSTVEMTDADGNTIKSGSSVKVGTVITVTVTPNTNYTVSAVKFNNTALTANDDGTYTITMPNKVSSLAVTTAKNSSYEFTADVDKTSGTKIGTKYEVTFTDNASFTGTKHSSFDVVVQVYNSSKVAAGYMIFKDVTTADTVTFYIPKNSTATVNFVDELDDSSNSLGTVIASKVSK